MGDVIVLGVLVSVVLAIVLSIVKKRRSGKGCGCGCESCEKRELCHPNQNESSEQEKKR